MADDKASVNEIIVKAAECPVTKVTVYKDRAEVYREVETTVKEGVNELHIKELVSLDEESIRVEGKGNATIAEVSFQSKFVSEDEATMTEKEKALNEELKSLQEERKALDLESQKGALKKQWDVLDKFASTAAKNGEGQPISLDANYFKGMREFIQQYKDIGKQLEAERFDLEKKDQELVKKIAVVESNLGELRGNRHQGHENRECVVVLEAEAETKVVLTVSYVVFGASWTPSYDLRMFTDQGILKVFYYGLIRQSSGEDWTNVKLYLSTAEPSIGGTIPTLPVTQLSVRRFRPLRKGIGFGTRKSPRLPPPVSDSMILRSALPGSVPPPPPPPPGVDLYSEAPVMNAALVAEEQVSETTTSTTYEIARLSTIPSDTIDHKVTVAIIELKPTLNYLTVPKVVPHAFLQAKVSNTSQYTLLAGRTSIFLDNNFVAKAEINSVAPKEEFECSLGVDPGVRVEYKPLVKMNSSSGIISKTQCTTYEQAIEIKNMHDYNVKVSIRDNLPRSLDEKIKVNLISPTIDMKHPEKTEGVRLTKNNHVEWDIDIKGMDKVEVLLKYTVEHPANEDIETSVGHGNQ